MSGVIYVIIEVLLTILHKKSNKIGLHMRDKTNFLLKPCYVLEHIVLNCDFNLIFFQL